MKHNFILETIAEKTNLTERRDASHALAEGRYALRAIHRRWKNDSLE